MPSRQIALRRNLFEFVIALGRPFREASFFEAFQKTAAPAGLHHLLFLGGQLAGAVVAAQDELGLLGFHPKAETTESSQVARGNRVPLADLSLGAHSRGFNLRALAV